MNASRTLKTALVVSLISGVWARAEGPKAGPRSSIPADPATVILDAFSSRPLVALAEGQHWNEQGHAFRLSLLRDPRFAARVDDIVVECGSSRYQDVMDRFVSGADVSYASLRHAWEDTTQPNTVWDMPIYEEFFRAVRDINRSLPRERRLRVLLGDPPIDWTRVSSKDEILAWMARRDAFAAELIATEVLRKRRHALIVYGDGHLFRVSPQPTLVSLLEKTAPGTAFTIATPTSMDLRTIQADVAGWPAPSITLLPGTTLGAAPFAPIYGLSGAPWESTRMESEFDALLYLGPPSSITLSAPSRARCSDPAYLRMRLSRMSLVPWGRDEIERLNRFCDRYERDPPAGESTGGGVR